ncbi:MAG: efflux RND transporter periplasmic adaptor subunit [Treponema sp.]|nr:efflux RND transporter periplasmic adaptor subunit [Treponema sp.]
MKKGSFKKIIRLCIFAAVALIFVFLIIIVTRKKPVAEKEETLPSVVIQKPQIGELLESVTISGYVEASAMIPVVPFVSGTITEYPARAGDFVKKDTLLAKIDDAPFRQQMLQAQAAYFAAKSTFDRIENLYKSGSTTQQNYDSAKAQADASKAQYDLAKLQVDYTEVRAPVDGTILIADQAVGGIGNQSQPVAVLADLTNQVVRLKVPEKYFDLFNLDRDSLKVKVTRPAEKNMFEDAVTSATIENIAPYVSPESKNFMVVCHLDQAGERFRPGMFVKVQVAYKSYKDVPIISLKARKMDGSFYVFDEETSTVKFVEGQPVPLDENNFIVPEEYRDSYIVMDGQNFVFDGQRVRVFEEALDEANAAVKNNVESDSNVNNGEM